MPPDPMTLFRDAFQRAAATEAYDHTVVTLATADRDGRPSVRKVLLKGVEDDGFHIFTNFHSRKARELDANPHAALCIYWPSLSEQIRVEGSAERLTEKLSAAYFASRPRGSQIGAWASRQSEPLASRDELESRYEQLEARFGSADIPKPDFWGGYLIRPERIEFWKEGRYRLHDRFLYERAADGWKITRLYP